jgi:hypothetical protein
MAFVALRIMVDGARDPTSHNRWPFEILQAGAQSGGDGSVGTGAEVRPDEEPMTASSAPSALFLRAIGGEVLAVACHGFRSGELPAGCRRLRAYRPRRADSPLAFHFFLALYFSGGMALAVWGLLILAGMAPPLK